MAEPPHGQGQGVLKTYSNALCGSRLRYNIRSLTLDNLFLERAIRSEGHCPGRMPKHPHARRFSFVPASPVVRERFRTRCELSRTDAESAPTVQRIKTKPTQNGNPGLKARACALSVSVPINFYLRSCYDREPHRSASLRKSPNPIKQRFHFRTGGRKQCGVCPLATQRKQSDVRQHNYKMRNSEVANRAVLFRSIR